MSSQESFAGQAPVVEATIVPPAHNEEEFLLTTPTQSTDAVALPMAVADSSGDSPNLQTAAGGTTVTAVEAVPAVQQYQAQAMRYAGTPVGRSATAPVTEDEVGVCRGCGAEFIRRRGTNSASADYYRCQRCSGAWTIECVIH